MTNMDKRRRFGKKRTDVPPVPPLPPIPESMKPGLTPKVLDKLVRKMKSRSDIQASKTATAKATITASANPGDRSNSSSSNSQQRQARQRPTLKSQISNPQLRLQAKSCISLNTFASPDECSITSPDAPSVSSRRWARHGSFASSQGSGHDKDKDVMLDYSIATKRLSPMEYTRMYLVECSLSSQEGRPCELPCPDHEWFWTPGWEKFLIVPRIPGSIKRYSAGYIPCRHGATIDDAEIPQSEKSLTKLSPSTATFHRLSLNLGGITAMFPSMMNLVSDMRVDASPHKPHKPLPNVLEDTSSEDRLPPLQQRSDTTTSPKTPSRRDSLKAWGRLSITPEPKTPRGSSSSKHSIQSHPLPSPTPTEPPTTPLTHFPVTPSRHNRLTPKAIAKQVMRRAGAQLLSIDDFRQGARLVQAAGATSLKAPSASASETARSSSSGGHLAYTDLQPAPLQIRRQRPYKLPSTKEVLSSSKTTPLSLARQEDRSEARVIAAPDSPTALTRRYRELHKASFFNAPQKSSGFTPTRRKPAQTFSALPDSPTLPSSDNLLCISDITPEPLTPIKVTKTRQTAHESLASRLPTPYKSGGTNTSTMTGRSHGYFHYCEAADVPLPPPIRKLPDTPTRKPHGTGSSVFSLHKAKSHEAFSILPNLRRGVRDGL